MIVLNLVGGLGNQMFQYAFGRSLAERYGRELKLDLYDLENADVYSRRRLGLQVFNTRLDVASKEDVRPFRRWMRTRFGRRLQSAAWRFLGLRKRNVVMEGEFSEDVLASGEGLYLVGYWQSEKYFRENEDVIRREFTLKEEHDVTDFDIARQIRDCISVAVHVRRGDYVTHEAANRLLGTCTPEYYAATVEYISGKVGNPHFFVFSDDIGWAKENIRLDHPVTWVSDGRLKDYEEMVLMSLCKHAIVANSSFSWWGAWLNRNPEKIVIAPKRWFSDPDKNGEDLVPKTWVRI